VKRRENHHAAWRCGSMAAPDLRIATAVTSTRICAASLGLLLRPCASGDATAAPPSSVRTRAASQRCSRLSTEKDSTPQPRPGDCCASGFQSRQCRSGHFRRLAPPPRKAGAIGLIWQNKAKFFLMISTVASFIAPHNSKAESFLSGCGRGVPQRNLLEPKHRATPGAPGVSKR